MRIDTTGLVRLGTANENTVLRSLGDSDEQIRIILFMGCLGAVSLDIGHRTTDHEVLPVHLRDERLEASVISSPVRLVDFVRHRVKRVDGIHPHAALKTSTRQLAQLALHLVLHHQILRTGCHVKKSVDALAGKRRNCSRQFRLLPSQIVRPGNRINGRANHRMIDRLINALANQSAVFES